MLKVSPRLTGCKSSSAVVCFSCVFLKTFPHFEFSRSFIHSFIFVTGFPMERVVGAAVQGGLEINQSTTILDYSAGSTPIRVQAVPEM